MSRTGMSLRLRERTIKKGVATNRVATPLIKNFWMFRIFFLR